MWIVLDSFLLHLSWACTVCQCTLCKVLNKEKRVGGAGIAVNMIPFIVLEIDPYLSIPCQVRSELSTKSMKRQLSILYCKICEYYLCYWYHVAQYYLSHLDGCSLLFEEEGPCR